MPFSMLTLLVSIGLLLTGHGIQITLLPLYAQQLGWSEDIISLTAASFFVGFMVGALQVPKLLGSVGYIRVFLSLSGCLAVVILCLSLRQDLTSWFILRFITGVCIAGIYVVAESWLNVTAEFKNRGKILAIYALTCLLGIGIGQTLVGLFEFEVLFQACAILMLIALIPVGLFCPDEPQKPLYIATPISAIKSMPRFAVAALLCGGAMAGSVWAVAPLFGKAQQMDEFQISMMMNAIVIGGALLQVPLGYLSDRFSRKGVLVATAAGCLVTIVMIPLSIDHQFLFLLNMGVFGGLCMTQLALCSAYANEETPLSRMQVASMLLLLNGTGSVLGPICVAAVSQVSDQGLVIVSAASMVLLLLAAYFVRSKNVQNADVVNFTRGSEAATHLALPYKTAQIERAA